MFQRLSVHAPRWVPVVAVLLTLVAASCGVSADLGAPAEQPSESTGRTEGVATPEPLEAAAEPTEAAPDPAAAPTAEAEEPDEVPTDEPTAEATAVAVDPDSPVSAGRYSWESSGCEFTNPPDVNVQCGWLTVPEDWLDGANDSTIRLHTAQITTGSVPGDAAPLVYLEGGPGGDSLSLLSTSFGSTWGLLAESHELVFYTQRGSALAEPHLNCPELEGAGLEAAKGADNADELAIEAATTCAERLRSEGVRLDLFNSVQSAHDLEALRLVLYDEPWNVIGVSYGTRLGQTLMRLHPDGVRAMVLDAVLPTAANAFPDIPKHADRAFGELFAACAASNGCNERWPDLEERFWAQVERLDEQPASFPATNPLTGQGQELVVGGDELVGLVFQALYSVEAFSAIPELVEQLEQGDTTGLSMFGGLSLVQSGFISEGMYQAVSCHEELPFTTAQYWVESAASLDRAGERFYDDGGLVDETIALCDIFDAGTADESEEGPVESDIPTLLLSGQFDPITPPAYADETAETLTNSTTVTLPHNGHGAVVDECGQVMIAAFLASPTDTLDTSCIEETAEPEWISDPTADLDLVTYADTPTVLSPINAAVPGSWTDQGQGIWYAESNLLHQTALVMQNAGGIGYSLLFGQFLGLLSGGADIENEPSFTDDQGREWEHAVAFSGGFVFDAWGVNDDGANLVVILQSAPADRDALIDQLMPSVLAGTSGA